MDIGMIRPRIPPTSLSIELPRKYKWGTGNPSTLTHLHRRSCLALAEFRALDRARVFTETRSAVRGKALTSGVGGGFPVVGAVLLLGCRSHRRGALCVDFW